MEPARLSGSLEVGCPSCTHHLQQRRHDERHFKWLTNKQNHFQQVFFDPTNTPSAFRDINTLSLIPWWVSKHGMGFRCLLRSTQTPTIIYLLLPQPQLLLVHSIHPHSWASKTRRQKHHTKSLWSRSSQLCLNLLEPVFPCPAGPWCLKYFRAFVQACCEACTPSKDREFKK